VLGRVRMIANGNDLEWGGLVLGMFVRLFR